MLLSTQNFDETIFLLEYARKRFLASALFGRGVSLVARFAYAIQAFVAASKYAEYKRSNVHVFAAAPMDEALVIAPPDFTLPAKMNPETLIEACREWLHW